VIDIPEQEAGTAGGSNPVAFRLAGRNNHVLNLSPGTKSGAVIQWDAESSPLDRLSLGSYPITWNLTGNLNDFTLPDGADNLTNVTWAITGYGNTFKTGTQNVPINIQPSRSQYAAPTLNGLSSAPLGNPNLSRGAVALNRTHDFIDKGASAYYFNSEDLWMCPQEVSDDIGGGTAIPILTADSTSECGWNFAVQTSGRTNQYVSAANTVNLYVGSQIPASKLRIYFKAKAASSTNISVDAHAGVTDLGSTTASLTTSSGIYSYDVDASSYSGQQFNLNFASVTANASIAWIAIRPWGDTLSTSITLGSGVAMTSNQGNGTKIQHSTGSTTTNDCVKFDVNGNAIDAGVSCSAGGGFSSGSNSNGRWVTDPTGTTTERGCISVTASGATHVTAAITFPQTFATALDSLVMTATNSPDGGDSGTAGTSLWATSTSTSGATANYRCVVDLGGAGCAAISNTVPICWIAIGR
jgi:hypothetical protein